MIRVAMLTPFFTGKLGGPYDVITELVSHLEKWGVNTKIFTTSSLSQIGNKRTEFIEKKSENLTIYRFDSFLRFREYRVSFKMFPFLLRAADEIDIIHSHALRSNQEDIGSFISLIKKKPLIINPHGGISINWDYGDKIPKIIYDITFGYLKRKILNPHFIAVAKNEIPVIKNYGIDENHIHYIPHGVNTKIFKPTDSRELKEKYGLEDFDILLYVGRIAKGKGVDKLIKILDLTVKRNKNIRLVIVGGDSKDLPIVKSLIQKYNLSKYVIFTGYISKKNLPKYYSMADIVVYPSRQEIFGLVITEASACGKPVIGSDILGPSEIIINGETGFTSNFENLTEVSNLIIDLLNDRNYLIQLGKNALNRVREKYSWEKSSKLYFELYKTVLDLT